MSEVSSPSDNFAFGPTVGTLRGVASWTEALHGRGGLADALSVWIEVLRASEGMLLRLWLDTGTVETVARVGRLRRDLPAASCGMAFSQYLLGHGLGRARAETVWCLSEFEGEIALQAGSGAGLRFGGERTRDVAVVVLAPGKRASDLLELHFPRRLSGEETKALSMLAGVLSQVWQRRSANVVEEALAEQVRGPDPSEEVIPTASSLLGAANPAGLSKAEYRVCMLMTHGLSAKLISRRLQISESTVRSHLRSIYAKTAASGQCELMYRLLAPDTYGPSPSPTTTAMARVPAEEMTAPAAGGRGAEGR